MNNKKGYLYIAIIALLLFTAISCKQQDQLPEDNISSAVIPTDTTRPAATLTEQTIIFDDAERTYLLRIPSGVDPTQPSPVVFVFHGMGEKARDMFKAGFNSVADEENIILVYPEIISHSTTEFIKSILQDVRSNVNVDPSRTYATGFSLGGKLTYHNACELSDSFAAFAALSGMAVCESGHNSERAVPIIHIHGLGDELVPYDTGRYGMPPVDETIASWVMFNECSTSPLVDEDGKITHTVYSECREGVVIELYTIDGLGHRVPIKEFQAARVIWDFFVAHPMP